MGKKLNSTVYLTDPDTGATEKWQSGRKLSAADQKRLGWPDDHESLVDDLDEDMSQEEAVDTGHPMADRIPADVGRQAEESQEVLETQRNEERAAVQDEAEVPEKERTGKGVPRR